MNAGLLCQLIEANDTRLRRAALGQHGAEGEDFLHDAYERVLRRAEALEIGPHFVSYMLTTVRRVCVDAWRRRKTATVALDLAFEVSDRTDVEEQVLASIEFAVWMEKVHTLPANYQTVLIPRLLGYSQKEVAALLCLPLSTVKARQHRGLRRLEEVA